MKDVVRLGEKVVALRDDVNRRFFSRGTENNRSHIQQILKIKKEVEVLKSRIASREHSSADDSIVEETTSTATAGNIEGQALVYKSLMSPDVPISELDHLPRDQPVVAMREIADLIRDSYVDKIYKIFPSLNDSTELIHDPELGHEREPHKGDLVIRNAFREFLVWTGDTDILARASETKTIDTFLRHSSTELENFVKFLEALKEMRSDTSHFIRDAICDYLLPQDAPCIALLGGRVASRSPDRKLGVDVWDILYRYFYQEDTWLYLEQYSVGFDDLLLVKQLSALYRYGLPDSDDFSWLHPEDDLSQEFQKTLFFGFVVQTKGFCDPKRRFTYAADGTIEEKESRDYVTGRMSKNDPLAKKLVDELASRLVRFLLIVYDRETGEPISRTGDVENEWICRTRTACSQDHLADAAWEMKWSVKNILDDLSILQSFRDRMMGKDFYEFVIINRMDRPRFDIVESVTDALMQHSGTSCARDTKVHCIRHILPSGEQDDLIEAILDGAPSAAAQSAGAPRSDYEGNRVRAWDIQENHPSILGNQTHSFGWSLVEIDVLSRILSSMEAAGVISQATKFETPKAIPKLLTAMDGHLDLYFDYSPRFRTREEFDAWRRENSTGPVSSNATLRLDGHGLRRFADDFKSTNPAAVFAKGTIHSHYNTWPFPRMDAIQVLEKLNFCTPRGHLYHWNHLPFDFPFAFEMWQFLLHCKINCQLPFVRATQTTFVICAETAAEAQNNAERLLAVADKMGWKLSFPAAHRWTGEPGSLDIEVLWRGIPPLCVHAR